MKCTGGKEERGERAPRAEGGASGPRGAAVHVQDRQPRHQREVVAWYVARDLLSTQPPCNRHHGARRWQEQVVVCECEKLAKGAQWLGRNICSAHYLQDSSKDAIPLVAQRSATVPARDPAVAEMKRGPRIRVAVDGVGHRHALRAEDEDKKHAHRIRYLTGHRGQRGSEDRYRDGNHVG